MLDINKDGLHFIIFLRNHANKKDLVYSFVLQELNLFNIPAAKIFSQFIQEGIITITRTILSSEYLKDYLPDGTRQIEALQDWEIFDDYLFFHIESAQLSQSEQQLLAKNHEIELDPARTAELIPNLVFLKHAVIYFEINNKKLDEKIKEFVNHFVNDLFNDGQTLKYTKLRQNLLHYLNKKIASGLSPNTIKIEDPTNWSDPSTENTNNLKSPLAPTLLALEQEGFLKINSTSYLWPPQLAYVFRDKDRELAIIVAVNEKMIRDNLKFSKLTKHDCLSSQFHFVDGILFRDHAEKIIKFSENELGYKILRAAFSSPPDTELDHSDVEIEKTKPMFDAARNLNKKINKAFDVPDFFYTDSAKKVIRRTL